jgi:hypothetical protein
VIDDDHTEVRSNAQSGEETRLQEDGSLRPNPLSRVGHNASGAIGQLPLPVKFWTLFVVMLFRLAIDGLNELQPPVTERPYEPGLTWKL